MSLHIFCLQVANFKFFTISNFYLLTTKNWYSTWSYRKLYLDSLSRQNLFNNRIISKNFRWTGDLNWIHIGCSFESFDVITLCHVRLVLFMFLLSQPILCHFSVWIPLKPSKSLDILLFSGEIKRDNWKVMSQQQGWQ